MSGDPKREPQSIKNGTLDNKFTKIGQYEDHNFCISNWIPNLHYTLMSRYSAIFRNYFRIQLRLPKCNKCIKFKLGYWKRLSFILYPNVIITVKATKTSRPKERQVIKKTRDFMYFLFYKKIAKPIYFS